MYFRIWETLYLCKWCNITDQPMSEKFRDEDGRFNKSNPQQSDIVFLLHTVLQVRHTLYSAKETQLKIIIFRKKKTSGAIYWLFIDHWSFLQRPIGTTSVWPERCQEFMWRSLSGPEDRVWVQPYPGQVSGAEAGRLQPDLQCEQLRTRKPSA